MKKLRKTKTVEKELEKARQEAEAAAERLAEVQALQEAAEKEEQEQMEATERAINELCEDMYFCGIILTHEDVLTIVNLAMENRENIRIPFKLYNL
jgi:DNA repair exonuclease SbcCD ATPase subunit